LEPEKIVANEAKADVEDDMAFTIKFSENNYADNAEELPTEDFAEDITDIPSQVETVGQDMEMAADTNNPEAVVTNGEEKAETVNVPKPYQLPKIEEILSKKIKKKSAAMEMEIAEKGAGARENP